MDEAISLLRSNVRLADEGHANGSEQRSAGEDGESGEERIGQIENEADDDRNNHAAQLPEGIVQTLAAVPTVFLPISSVSKAACRGL